MFSAKPLQQLMTQLKPTDRSLTLKWLVTNESSKPWPAIPRVLGISQTRVFTYSNIWNRVLQPSQEVEVQLHLTEEDIRSFGDQFISV